MSNPFRRPPQASAFRLFLLPLLFLAHPLALAAFAPAAVADEATITPVSQLAFPDREGLVLQPGYIRDEHIVSPKSVNFHPGGKKVYVNALEGLETLVYSWPDLRRLAAVRHTFGPAQAGLFKDGETTIFGYAYYHRGASPDKNVFSGKPVEGAFSHGGRYFWAPYYRRDYDRNASGPSAVGIIDTETDSLVRVMPTGPLPKMVAASPDGKLLAVTHWGDNTIGLIDVSSDDPADFTYVKHLVDVSRLDTRGISGNRDNNCGKCLRGTVFSPDGRYLLVGRMAGGGISVFSVPGGEYRGSFSAFSPSPRHLVVDPERDWLYASDSRLGLVGRVRLSEALASVADGPGRTVPGPPGEKLNVGVRPRTVALSPDGESMFAALHGSKEIVRVDTKAWRPAERVSVSPFPVGLDVSPDGAFVGVTSQGRLDNDLSPPRTIGGNSVEFFSVAGK
ncbi:MAG: YncE family protein [Deltaproteobacteria bacterium]|jgi:DNA-binding beta-propeller fold protein YncE|nr:YncE family protein [Deltaproteobacteria bacterium]